RGHAVGEPLDSGHAPAGAQHDEGDARLEQERRGDDAKADPALVRRQQKRDAEDDGDAQQADREAAHLPGVRSASIARPVSNGSALPADSVSAVTLPPLHTNVPILSPCVSGSIGLASASTANSPPPLRSSS